jgi:hypothetical protein
MKPPRIPVLLDAENRLRHDWQQFIIVWQATADTWKDSRRQQFENEHLKELPGLLSRTSIELMEFRDLLQKAARSLSDNDSAS